MAPPTTSTTVDHAGQEYFVHYMKMREMCLKSSKNAFSTTGNPVINAENALEKKFMDVFVSADSHKNPEDIIELGLRLYGGCQIPKDVGAALRCFHRLVDKRSPNYVPNVSRSLRARAYACIAYINFQEYEQSPGTANTESLYRAGLYIDKCASLGLTPSTLYIVASTIQSQGLRHKKDNKPFDDRFSNLDSIWEEWDKHQAVFRSKMEKRGEKLDKNPNSYQCAAEGCGIQATKKSGLMSCAGPCPAKVKPAYCSKQCQVKDWKRHKPVCTGKGKTVETRGTATADSTSATAHDGEQTVPIAGNLRNDGRELGIEIANPSGQPISVSTKTMSPELLRDFRFHVEKLLREHTQ